MTQVFGAIGWSCHKDIKPAQESWPRGPEDKDEDGGSLPGACKSPGSGPLNSNQKGSLLGLVDFQARDPRGTAGWRKGATAPGEGGARGRVKALLIQPCMGVLPGPCPGCLATRWAGGQSPGQGLRPRAHWGP
ncbi:hypothetical protein NDU88_006286 [Pleurodeles waltl]|uniref:Uncharacterized protein n=1 Tax=Pleurodeles waltl TaxID=8319 RepID=A0AAV7PN10_PLEWA|nr:hypothetical protein NDU88_006286 [Pleurodeles waltl]